MTLSLENFINSPSTHCKVIVRTRVKINPEWLHAKVYILGTLMSATIYKKDINNLSHPDILSYTLSSS